MVDAPSELWNGEMLNFGDVPLSVSSSNRASQTNCSSRRETPPGPENNENSTQPDRPLPLRTTGNLVPSKRSLPNSPDSPVSGNNRIPSTHGDNALSSSARQSAVANPPSEQRQSPLPTTHGASMTPPASHVGVPEHVGGAFERRSQPQIRCSFMEYIRDNPKQRPNRDALLGFYEQAKPLITEEDIADFHKWMQIRILPSTPPSVDSSNHSGQTNRVGYLCPGVLGEPQQNTPSANTSGKFGCPLCGKRCTRKNDLWRHLQTQNPAMIYGCRAPSCRKEYNRIDKYKQHVKRHHPNMKEKLNNHGTPVQQAFPERCLHCTEQLNNFDHWFEHWVTVHRANPNTPRRIQPENLDTEQASRLYPLTRYINAEERLVGNLPTGAKDFSDLDQSTGKLVRDAQGYTAQ